MFLTALRYAFKRSTRFRYEVEGQEVKAELIGGDDNTMFWESAEGGTGMWDRMMGWRLLRPCPVRR